MLYILFLILSQDALEFVGWELIGVISRAFVDGIELDVLEECNRILRVIAEVSE